MSDAVFRHVGSQPEAEPTPVRRGRNIVAVIGIDEYQHWPRLDNAVSDAQGILDLFLKLNYQRPLEPLLNAQATQDAIQALVQDDLRKLLKPDDTLVLFFAGHGHTEVSSIGDTKIETGYLIPVGGQAPDDGRLSTYLRLDFFLDDVAKLPARHILVIVDACHSGFAMGNAVRKSRGYERYTNDLERLVSRQVLTSAKRDQKALDGGPVPGHSLFTGTLIEALDKGKADDRRRGFVTGLDLAQYVRTEVASASISKQTPDFGAFNLHDDGDLVIALQGESQNKNQAAECLEIAHRVEALGRATGDRRRFTFAAGQYQEAIRFAALAKSAYPEAELGLGRSLLASGDAAAAAQALGELAEREGERCPPETNFYLGMARAGLKDYAGAAKALQSWRSANPHDPNAAWAGEYVQWLESAVQAPGGRKLALLIGIDHYRLKETAALQGCVNDAGKLMKTALTRICGFAEADITLLADQQATSQAVRAAFEGLRAGSAPQDTVFIHFSGHSVPSSAPDYFGKNDVENVYLLLHDTTDKPGHLSNGITAPELHQFMQAIPAGHKTLVLDTHASLELVDLAQREGTYALVMASDTAEVAYEWKVQFEGQELPCGMLTGALYQSLERAGRWEGLTYYDWVQPAVEIAGLASADPKYPQPQTPYFSGPPERCIFGGEDHHQAAFQFILRGRWPERTAGQLEKEYRQRLHEIKAPVPRLHQAYGRALLAAGAARPAAGALQQAVETGLEGDPDAWLDLGSARLRAGEWTAARAALEKALVLAQGNLKNRLAAIEAQLSQLKDVPRRARLFFITLDKNLEDVARNMSSAQAALTQIQPGTTPLPEPLETLERLKKILAERYNFQPEALTVHLKAESKVKRILEILQEAAGDPAQPPTLVCLVGADSSFIRQTEDLQALRDLVKDHEHLFIWVQKSALG